MKLVFRATGACAAAAALALAGTGSAAAEPNDWIQEGTLDVFAVTAGPFTAVAVTNAEPGYVCISDPAGDPIGPADEYGQALVDGNGFAALTVPGTGAASITVICGPRYSEWSNSGTAEPLVLS
ncbi:hypothetical protein [Hoyosella altamirensis]|uniref:Uncharacterized protein n=1 Tax=Hoyosella altamirensis TaxID=616997 RepID=A0A839RU56_9ACTN|nr:hypothetical protein [Hoyosella altamirensis]MBB3039748.1 hypothetical protein [Hoyosella altamirensis]